MIYQDENGYPVERHMDGGDSAMRFGIATLTGLQFPKGYPLTTDYEMSYGYMTRHPKQLPWNNKLNCTRDQLIPFVAGMNRVGNHSIIRRLALMHFLRLSFCQDSQRDYPGTWKLPYPQHYADLQGNVQYTYFNFADPLLPNHWWTLIKGAKLYPLYIFYPICLLFCILAVKTSNSHPETNQMIAELSFHQSWLMRLYVKWNPEWLLNTIDYWDSRNEQEYGNAIVAYVKGRL